MSIQEMIELARLKLELDLDMIKKKVELLNIIKNTPYENWTKDHYDVLDRVAR